MQSLTSQLTRPQSTTYRGSYQPQFEDDLTRSNTSNSVTASTISDSGSARTASTLGSPKSFSAHHFIQWQVKTESNLKEKEGKLKASLCLTNRLNDELLKIRSNNEAIASQTKFLEQEQVSLLQSLDKLKSEALKMIEQLKLVKFGSNKFSFLKEGLRSTETQRSADVDVLTDEIAHLQVSYDTKIDFVVSLISSDQQLLKSTKDALRVNRESKVTDVENLGSCLRKIKEDFGSISVILHGLDEKSSILKQNVDGLEFKFKLNSENTILKTKEKFENESNFEKKSRQLEQEEIVLSSKLDDLDQELAKIDKSTKKVISDLELNQEEMKYFQNLLSEHLGSNKVRSEEESNLHMELSKNVKKVDDLKVQLENIDKLKNEIVCLKNVLAKSESQRLETAGKVGKLVEADNLKDQLEVENFSLCQNIHKLEAQVNSRTTEIADLKDVIKKNELSSQKKEADLKTLTKGVMHLMTLKDDLDVEENELNSRSSKLMTRRKEKEKEVDNLKKEKSNTVEKDLNIEVLNYNESLDIKKNSFHDEEVKFAKLKDKRKELKALIESKQDQIKTFDEKITFRKESFGDTSRSDKDLRKQLQNLRTKLRKQDKELSKINGQVDQRTQIESKLKEELTMAGKEEVKINEIVKNLRAEVEILKSSLTTLETEVDKGRDLENQMKLDLEQIKRLEKNLSVSKRSLTSATKSHEKLMKQFDKNSNSLLSLKSESSEFEEILKKNQSMEKDLNKEIISLEKELSNYINSSNEVSPNVQRVSQSVIDQQEDFKSKLTSEHRIMVREYEGTLICKERENEKSLKDLKDDIERLSKSLESNSTKLKVLMADLEKIDEDEDMNDGAFKIFNQVEEAKNSLTSLERHLKERREEGTKLESQLENLKQYDSPNPAGRFFKTPRTQALPSYKSPIIPSPRKKMATGDSVKTPPSTPRR